MRRGRVLVREGAGVAGIGRRLAAVAAFVCLSLGTVSAAGALTLAEFDRLPAHQKENFISTVLHFQHYRYAARPATAGTARCMVELDSVETQGGDPYLYALIMRDLDVVRTNTGRARTVEKVIRQVIDRECKNY